MENKIKQKEWNDLITKTNNKICANFDIKYFFDFNDKYDLGKTKLLKNNVSRNKTTNKNYEIELPVLLLIIFSALIATVSNVIVIFDIYTSPTSYTLYCIPCIIFIPYVIWSILKCRIVGFDNYKMEKYFTYCIYWYNFLIFLSSIWGLVVHVEISHLIFFSCFLSFSWLVNIFCKLFNNNKKYKLKKFIKSFILLEILKRTDLNIEQYMIKRYNMLQNFCSLFKKRLNKALKQEKKKQNNGKDDWWDKTWEIMFCNIHKELNLLKTCIN